MRMGLGMVVCLAPLQALIGDMHGLNTAEHQPTFVRHLRALADDELRPDDAVRSYHDELSKLGIQPHRSLESDVISLSPDTKRYS